MFGRATEIENSSQFNIKVEVEVEVDRLIPHYMSAEHDHSPRHRPQLQQ